MLKTASSRLALAALVVSLLALWWVSGLGRRAVDPREFFTEEQIAAARAYQAPRYIGYAVGVALGLAVLVALAFTPLGDRLLHRVRALPWPVAAAAAAVLVILVRAAVRLPLSYWRGHLHERAYGFSTQSATGWLLDWAKALGISIALTALVYVGFVGLVRAFPRAWPSLAAAGAAVLVVVLSFLSPVVIEPIFNRFTPLDDRSLVQELKTLAERAGVPVKEVLVADASRRTTKENAYVSGFGHTRRLVLHDTLLLRDRDEVILVAAHELGHRRHRHVELGTLMGAAAAAASVGILWLVIRSGAVMSAARATGPADPRLLPLLLLVVSVLPLAIQPPSNWVSRRFETAADRFALQITGESETYVETERGLALRNLSDLDPNPFVYRFLFTHPAPAERIALAFEEGA
jgi:Zn-dependent protease with chaperone function